MKKFFLTVLLATITVLSVFGLSSCDEECTHEWGEWSVSSPSTCAAQGTKQRKCSKCDEVQTESIDIADHEYDTENLVWTWNGYESATATLSCITDSTHTRQINANVTDEVTTAPTCTATGTKTYTATVKIDGITYTATKNETLAALGHTEVTDAAVAATCEKTGLTEGSHCSVCKEVLVAQQETPKAAHTETKIEAVAATCSAEGATEGVKCSACGEILVAPQPTSKVAHTEETIPAVAATCEKAGLTEGKKCSVCGEVLVAQTETALADHTEEIVPAVAATCSENGLTEGKKCSICDEVLVAQQPTDKLPHTETALLGVAPSCSEEGLTEGKKCSVCGTVTVAQEPIDKLPHTEETVVGTAPTCSTTGLSDGKKCFVCKETLVAQTILPKVACDYESVITAPTCEAQGYTTHTCSMCKESFVDTYVDELGHNWGAWEVSGSYTLRNCINECNCGKYQRISSISATYNGIRLLTGESVWKDDVVVTATLSDGTTLDITDFTLENDVMTVDGINYVTVKFNTLSTDISVPAIYDNLSGTTAAVQFEYTESGDAITITKFIGTATNVVIPNHINRVPVRAIATSAFANCVELISVTIPGNIKTIDTYCFQGCKRLETVTFNEGLQTINGAAFMGCPITSITIPNSVVTINAQQYGWSSDNLFYGAFEDCTQLKTVVIGSSLENIARETFRGCTALTKVVIGDRVQTIGTYAFAGCSELVDVTIGKGVKTIEANAFENCTSLPSITIGTGVQTLGAYAFANCVELTSIEIPGNVKTIDIYCFNGCKRLETVTFNEGLQTINGAAFIGCPITSITIPNSVVTINAQQYGWSSDNLFYGAFEDCTQLKTVVIGSSLENIARETFRGCTSLTDVTIGERVETIGAYAFANCTALEYIYIPENVLTIDDHAFDGCIYLDNIDFGTGVNSVGSYAFSGCTDLTAITIPDNVITLGNNVFNNCTALQDVTIEKSKELVRSFGSNVFNGCSNLDRIYYTGTSEEWAEITINSNNVYPLSVTPYFYSENQPSAVGDYWYYNSSGLKRVWNITDIAFEAEYYSENFVDLFGDESSSYSTLFYNNITNDAEFMSDLYAWETLNIIANSSLVDGVWKVSKKDLYKVLLYDLMCGQPDAQEHIFDSLEYATLTYVAEFTKEFAGEIKSDEIFTIPASAVNCAKLAKYGIVGLEGYFERAENLHEALESCAREKAFSDMNVAFQMLLMRIANDSSAPQDLRDAARECAELYQTVTQEVYEKMISDSEDAATNKAIVATFAGVAWDWFASKAFPGLSAAQLAAKGLLLLANLGYNVDDVYMSFYKLSAAVKLEAALRNIIEDTLPDYYRISNRANAENYVYAVDMYKTSVLLGFDYSNALLRAEAEAKLPDEKLEYELMMLEISIMQDQKQELYESFDELVSEAYVAYYS